MTNSRKSGVLLPLSSVNGNFGVGVMGDEARSFIMKLKRMGFGCWQVLPTGTADDMNSPYCSQSVFAGNYIYIDPEALLKKGLVSREQVEDNIYHGSCYTSNYLYAQEKRLSLLRAAFRNLGEREMKSIESFSEEYSFAGDFALYMSIKERNGLTAWWEWDDEYKYYDRAVLHKDELKEDILFWLFVQQEFYSQWLSLKNFANENGIEIIGDMPIYVSLDSVDVWCKTDMFKLDPETLKPKKVAGVPPDYFSENGQKWGNPIYDWDKMEKDGYRWWIDRIAFSLKIYDTVRIDHFRAFASYWEIDADAETAKTGQWQKGPGMKLFDAVKKELPSPSIVAEDLGIFGEDVVRLLEDTGFPGMRVIQFGFDPYGDSTHLPHNYDKNCVAYVGTHDNNTILGWLYEAREDQRRFALDYCGFHGNDWGAGGYYSASCRAVIEAVWRSSANTAIVAFQDMCGFGSDARTNTPGTAENNWLYRAGKDAVDAVDEKYFIALNTLYRRNNKK